MRQNIFTRRVFKIEYWEFGDDDILHFYDYFIYFQKEYQQFTLRDVKEYVKEQRLKKHKPVCSCSLQICEYNNDSKSIIIFLNFLIIPF